jgi:putative phosphoesterase
MNVGEKTGMLVGVVSDTHGNREGMLLLAKRLKFLGVEILLHLGDDYQDLATLAQAGLEVLGVPGLYCPEYRNPDLPNRRVVELGGIKFLLTHTETRTAYDSPDDLDPEVACYEVDAVLYAHTHVPKLDKRQGVAWINPGHLRHRADRGHPPSFAVLHISPQELKVQVLQLVDGLPILEKNFRVPVQR